MNPIEMSNHGYLLMFHNTESWRELGREELKKYVEKNNAWLTQLMTSGKAKGGQALARKGAMISGKNGCNVTDGPYAESKEVVGGYLLLDVETMEEAIAIARTAPNLGLNLSVEVRPLTNVCASHTRLEELTREEQLALA